MASNTKGMLSAFEARKRLLSKSTTASAVIIEKLVSSPVEDEEPVRRSKRQRSEPSDPTEKLVKKKQAESQAGPQAGPQAGAPTLPVRPYSTFSPTRKKLRRKTGCVALRIDEGERLVVLGSYGIQVIRGEVTVLGATIRPEHGVRWVHAPHSHALPVLRCSENAADLEFLNHPGLASLRQLERLSPVFGKLWHDADAVEPNRKARDAAPPDSFQIIYSSTDCPKRALLQMLKSPPEWNKALARIADPGKRRAPATLICGPKSSGKSTFSKLLANRFVTDERTQSKGVAILDLDSGQPEFSPPGVVCLVHLREPNLGPPFSHPTLLCQSSRIVRSHAFTAATPSSDPDLYMECAIDLVQCYRTVLRDCPLIVNTPGWVQGTGLGLLSDLIENLRPSEVVYMSLDGPQDTVDTLKSAAKTASVTTLPSQPSEYTSRTAAHLRTMQTMSYFHMNEADGRSRPLSWQANPLSTIPPLLVPFRGRNNPTLGVMFYGDQRQSNLADEISGMILAVVEIQDAKALRGLLGLPAGVADDVEVMDVDEESSSSRVSEQLGDLKERLPKTPEGIPILQSPDALTLDPRHSQFLGLVLVQAVNKEECALQVITPLSADKVRRRNIVLVSGWFDTPTWAYAEELYRRSQGDIPSETLKNGPLEVVDEDTEEDSSEVDESPHQTRKPPSSSYTPYVETLSGGQKRTVGSRVWRVRRDLGKGAD